MAGLLENPGPCIGEIKGVRGIPFLRHDTGFVLLDDLHADRLIGLLEEG